LRHLQKSIRMIITMSHTPIRCFAALYVLFNMLHYTCCLWRFHLFVYQKLTYNIIEMECMDFIVDGVYRVAYIQCSTSMRKRSRSFKIRWSFLDSHIQKAFRRDYWSRRKICRAELYDDNIPCISLIAVTDKSTL